MPQSNLAELAAFVAVARRKSFKRASIDLAVSASAVSHAIRQLEDRLGLVLVNRTTRSVALTEAGQQLFERLGPAFEGIDSAIEDLNLFRAAPYGTLRINAPRQAARLVLTPLVAAFGKAYPQMKVEITGDDMLSDVVRDGFDAGVRFGELVAEDMIATPIGPPLAFAVVGTPTYFATRPQPRHPNDLKDHDCVCYRYPSGRAYHWEFQRGAKHVEVAAAGRFTFDDMDVVLDTIRESVGLGYVFEKQVAKLVAQGELIRVLEPWCPPLPGFFLYYPSRRNLSFGLRAFVEFARGRTRPN